MALRSARPCCEGTWQATPVAVGWPSASSLGWMNTCGSGLELAVALAEQAVAAEVAVLQPAGQARVGDAEARA